MKLTSKTYLSRKIADYGAAKVREYYTDLKAAFSLALVEYDGRFPNKGYIINHQCNETYLIIKGKFEIRIKGKRTYKLRGFDSLLVPKGSIYSIKGKGKLIAINDPPWREKQFEEVV